MLLVLASIWLLHVAALSIPGANTMIVSHLAVSGQRKSAVYAAIGIAVGAAIWASAAALGIKALFEAFPTFRFSLQVVGAGYLLYIAFRLWKSSSSAATPVKELSAARAFQLGLLTNLSNPKAALFFGSIFSTSLSHASGHEFLLLAVVLVVTNCLLWHLMLAWLFSRERLQTLVMRRQLLLGRVASGIIGVFAVKLLCNAALDSRA